MLTRAELLNLVEVAEDAKVLSAYVSADVHDPADRRAWRLRLTALLDEARQGATDTEAFDRARRRIEAELEPVRGFLPGPGWIAFATADRLLWSGSVPAPVPDVVRWRSGPLLWPSLRSRKQLRPVVVVLTDSRNARIFEYGAGAVREVQVLGADAAVGDVAEHAVSKRPSTHTGTRGETGTDAAQRANQEAAARLVREIAAATRQRAGAEAPVVIGGTREATAALRRLLSDSVAADRLHEEPALHLGMSPAEIREVVEIAASRVTEQLQRSEVARVVEQAEAGGRGALGLIASRYAAESGQVDRLLVTAAAATRREAEVEELIGACIRAGGEVDAVGGAAAAELDARGEGVGAVLRYTRHAAQRVPEAAGT